ncbi:MAG: hypothetical protein VB102_14310 [Paludibacter sp.]|nr:hypothetical protein [Paludibacter sp.]
MNENQKVFEYIRTKWIQNERHTFFLQVSTILNDLNIDIDVLINTLNDLNSERKIRYSSGGVRKETYHTDDLKDQIIIFECE